MSEVGASIAEELVEKIQDMNRRGLPAPDISEISLGVVVNCLIATHGFNRTAFLLEAMGRQVWKHNKPPEGASIN